MHVKKDITTRKAVYDAARDTHTQEQVEEICTEEQRAVDDALECRRDEQQDTRIDKHRHTKTERETNTMGAARDRDSGKERCVRLFMK